MLAGDDQRGSEADDRRLIVRRAELQETSPAVSVVIGTYNRRRILEQTIETTRAELRALDHEIIVIDGGSTDRTPDWLAKQRDIISILQHNRGEWRGAQIERKSWGYFMNLGFRVAHGKFICMLSDDCLVLPGSITNGLSLFEEALGTGVKVGAVAFYWRDWPRRDDKYVVGLTFGDRMFVNHGLYLSEAVREIGLADEGNYAFYHADGDMCLRLWEAGYRCIDSPESFIEHFSDATPDVRASNREHRKRDWEMYAQKWGYLGNPERDWLERRFVDPHQTAERYWGTKRRSRWFDR